MPTFLAQLQQLVFGSSNDNTHGTSTRSSYSLSEYEALIGSCAECTYLIFAQTSSNIAALDALHAMMLVQAEGLSLAPTKQHIVCLNSRV